MPNAWDALLTGLLALSALGVCVSCICNVLVWHVLRRPRSTAPSADSVTLLRPLCGVDACLAENLQACSRQSHRPLNMVLGVADQDDAALPVALRFARDSEQLPTRVSVGEDQSLENPKVALLERMSWYSDGDWVVVSDSNVRVTPEYVRDTLAHAAPDVGLITHLVAGCGGRSFASLAENLQLNCFVAPAVCGARFLAGQTCVIGKSMFLRRQALADIGGFQSAGQYLAEDYVIGQAIVRAGYRVVTASAPIPAWHEGWTLGRFFNRHLRWAVMRRSVSKSAYLVELLLNPAPLSMLLWLLSQYAPLPGIRPLWILVLLGVEQAFAAVSFSCLTGRLVPLGALLVNPVRQWLALGIWVLGWFVETVEWRGKAYRIGAGSLLRPATGPVPARVIEP